MVPVFGLRSSKDFRLYSHCEHVVLFKCELIVLLFETLLGIVAPFNHGCKNLQACGGHPVGEEIDFAGC